MQVLKAKNLKKVVFFGTGGTISGLSGDSNDVLNYKAGLVGVGDLAQSAFAVGSQAQEFEPIYEQIAQIDSKDMVFSVWQKLLERLLHWSSDPQVEGFLITHGTDTIEETAFFLSLVTRQWSTLPTIALTCAMRPASAKDADGPQNLRDATALVLNPEWRRNGVVVVCAGQVHSGACIQKVFSDRLDAFSSLPNDPLGLIEGGVAVKLNGAFKAENTTPNACLKQATTEQVLSAKTWPWVEIVQNYANNTGAIVNALVGFVQPDAQTLAGLVIAGTGIGTVSEDLLEALQLAKQRGVLIWQSTRCAFANVKLKEGTDICDFHGLSPVKARIALILHLLAQ